MVRGPARSTETATEANQPIVLDLTWITAHLAIGARFDPERSVDLVAEHRIGAVVDLREEDCDDVALLRVHGIDFLHLPTPDVCGAPPDVLTIGVEFASRHIDAGRRVLVHCQHGVGRSSLLVLCVLVARGHRPIDALMLAKDRRAKVSPSPAQYEAWADWLRSRDHAPIPSFDEFAFVAYRHLREPDL
jgi:protein-tyrosine phosphatase